MAELGLKSRFFFLNFTSFKKTLSFVFGSGVTYSQRNHNKSLFPWPAKSLFLPDRACTLSLQGPVQHFREISSSPCLIPTPDDDLPLLWVKLCPRQRSQSPNPQYLFGNRVFAGYQVKMSSLGWAQIQYDWCS